MNREEVYKRLNEVFIDVFDEDNIALNDKMTSDDIDGWDSLTHITLIATIEDEFGIHFEMDSITSMKNVGSMVDAILEKVGK